MKIRKLTNKKSQAELITTVLLILISIAAVALVATFVVNLVKQNLRGTECLQATGSLLINTEGGYTYFDNDTGINNTDLLYVNIERGSSEYNLSGFSVIFGDGISTKKIKVMGTNVDNVFRLNSTSGLDNTLKYPNTGESLVYAVNVTAYGFAKITKVSVAPLLEKGLECEKSEEKIVSMKPAG